MTLDGGSKAMSAKGTNLSQPLALICFPDQFIGVPITLKLSSKIVSDEGIQDHHDWGEEGIWTSHSEISSNMYVLSISPSFLSVQNYSSCFWDKDQIDWLIDWFPPPLFCFSQYEIKNLSREKTFNQFELYHIQRDQNW